MKICIFCGSGNSVDPQVALSIDEVMKSFAQEKVTLVYGGAAIGIMGGLATKLMTLGGEVIGVIPQQLMKKEIVHAGLTENHVVPDMHARKKMMYDLSDAFLIFPGGMGTMDELFEILTWRQLGFHNKPIAILNINGFYDHLIRFIDHASAQGLISPAHRKLLFASENWSEVWSHFQESAK
jgi:uncharacterized protein (TIGR00730 family)